MNQSGRFQRVISIILIIGVIVLVVSAFFAPQPLDWTYSYSNRHTKPLGTRLVYNVINHLFPGQELIVKHSGLNDFLEEATPVNTNFIYINNHYNPICDEVSRLLEVVGAGNHVFIAAESLSECFEDTFNLRIRRAMPPVLSITNDSIGYHFANKNIQKGYQDYWFKKVITNNYFESYDSTRTTVLGHNNRGRTNFIKIQHGEGAIFVNANPIAFTNYHLLSGNKSEYIFKSLSYLPVTTTVWDESYKAGVTSIGSEIDFILADPALRMAWYLTLIAAFFWLVFHGKRRQRAIPIIHKPRNITLSFVETISRLYLLKNDHAGIARKRFLYFKEYIRNRYFIQITSDESKNIEEISEKSGVRERSVAALFRMAKNLDRVKNISQEDLQQFNRQLEFFYKNCR
ncbi:DUF4350 domain-containing protein [Natronoflexus pectinivorans]|uniref:DUF4350 domain-containing protein n=1 Tax=Natronoflexus pectinivorans TaxID=682526 RepID=A0A4R2GRJ2_9BACT|nr:DUF4350 domain-containing protein [Natronoflexus pectinivorans]TCO10766.1 hypothetical protein EV194_101398 [Natronoflexus pectinivorans]